MHHQNPMDQLGIHIGRIDSAFDQWIHKQGLSYASFAVLYTLATAEGGSCTQKRICEEWFLSKQTVFSICKGLIMPLAERARAFGTAVFQAFGQERAAQLLAEMDALSTLMERTINTNDASGKGS